MHSRILQFSNFFLSSPILGRVLGRAPFSKEKRENKEGGGKRGDRSSNRIASNPLFSWIRATFFLPFHEIETLVSLSVRIFAGSFREKIFHPIFQSMMRGNRETGGIGVFFEADF